MSNRRRAKPYRPYGDRYQPVSTTRRDLVPVATPHDVAGVMLGYCSPGTVSTLFHDSLMGLMLWDQHNGGRIGRKGGYASLISGPRIASGRTRVVDAFLAHPNRPEWLWFLDTDMAFEPDALERLLDAADPVERPIVGGLCFGGGRDCKVFPTLYVLSGDGMKMDMVEDYPRDTLCQVDATGAACILVHRSVFERMEEAYPRPYPWFQETVVDGMEFGEDITFCLRAKALGIPTHVHTGVRIGHQKVQLIDEAAFEAYREKSAARDEEAVNG